MKFSPKRLEVTQRNPRLPKRLEVTQRDVAQKDFVQRDFQSLLIKFCCVPVLVIDGRAGQKGPPPMWNRVKKNVTF